MFVRIGDSLLNCREIICVRKTGEYGIDVKTKSGALQVTHSSTLERNKEFESIASQVTVGAYLA